MNNTITLETNFFFGGNATFTIESLKSGQHKTFKIRRPEPTPMFPHPCYFVSLLTGPNNETDYCYIGKVNELTGELTLTRGSKRNEQIPDVVVFRWFMSHLFGDKILTNAVVHHEGRCGCCARKLTVPESIIRGIEPECAKRFGV
jgi:hypothetical protein